MKSMLNIKIDRELKEEAKKVAQDLGLPMSTVVNHYLKDFVQERRVIFTDHPMPNLETRKMLDKALKDVQENKNIVGPFTTAREMMESLKK